MTSDLNKYDEEFGDFDFNAAQDDNSVLDKYGVWIKKRPDAMENKIFEDDFSDKDFEIDTSDSIGTIDTSEENFFDENFLTEDLGENLDGLQMSGSGEFDDGIDFNDFESMDFSETEDIFSENNSSIDDINIIDIDEEDGKPDEDNNFFEEIDTDVFPEKEENGNEEKDKEEEIVFDDEYGVSIDSSEFISENETNAGDESLIDLDLTFDEDFAEEKSGMESSSDAFDSMLDEFEPFSLDTEEEVFLSEENKDSLNETEDLSDISGDTEDVSEFDTLLDSLNENTDFESDLLEDEKAENSEDEIIDLNVEVDEASDITSITTQKDFDEHAIMLTPPDTDLPPLEKESETKEEDSGVVIKNTVIEPANIEAIREENRKILYNGKIPEQDIEENDLGEKEEPSSVSDMQNDISLDEDFNDIEAFTKDITEDYPDEQGAETENFFEEPENVKAEEKADEKLTAASSVSNQPENNSNSDKTNEILMQIMSEISNLKSELSNLKTEFTSQAAKISEQVSEAEKEKHSDKNTDDKDNTGFFMDSDSDETIALTGDELNNILITADFTDDTKNFSQNQETPEVPESIGEDFNNKAAEETESFNTQDYEIRGNEGADEDFEIPEELITDIEYAKTDSEEGSFEDKEDKEIETAHINSADHDFTYLDEEEPVPEDFQEKSETGEISEAGEADETPIEEFDTENSDVSEFDGIPDSQEIDLSAEDFDSMNAEDVNSVNEEISEKSDSGETESAQVENAQVNEGSGLKNISNEIHNSEKERKISSGLTDEIKSVLAYMDQLLESLPDNKIKEFAESEYFEKYNKIFDELGIS